MNTTDDDFPPDYADRIDRVCSGAADEFRRCRGDLLTQLHVCCRLFARGEKEGISHGELVDFLGVSASCALNRADYTDEEALRVMDALRYIRYDEHGTPHPPVVLPHD